MKPDFQAMFARAIKNEVGLRGLLAAVEVEPVPEDKMVNLIGRYTAAADLVGMLQLMLNEIDTDDDEDSSDSPTSSLQDTIDGEGAEESW